MFLVYIVHLSDAVTLSDLNVKLEMTNRSRVLQPEMSLMIKKLVIRTCFSLLCRETSSTCSSDPGLFTNDEGRQGIKKQTVKSWLDFQVFFFFCRCPEIVKVWENAGPTEGGFATMGQFLGTQATLIRRCHVVLMSAEAFANLISRGGARRPLI